MKAVPALRHSLIAALLLVAGCAGMDSRPVASPPTSDKPLAGVSARCEAGCNSEYDACMDRFSGVSGGPGLGRHQDDSNSALGPNDVCPDQLKSCLKRCAP